MAFNRLLTIPDSKRLFMGGYRGWHTERSGMYALSTSSNIQNTSHCPMDMAPASRECFGMFREPTGYADVINIQLPKTHALSLVTYNKASVSSEYLFREVKG
jgi:hypothetical protein